MALKPINCTTNGSALANDYRLDINTTPSETTQKWAIIQAGVTDITMSTNDSLDQTNFMNGAGWGSTEVVGAQLTASISLNRIEGDEAQDFVLEKAFHLGCQRKTHAKITAPNGDVRQGEVTIANITLPGGSAGSAATFSFDIHFNGEPEFVEAGEVTP